MERAYSFSYYSTAKSFSFQLLFLLQSSKHISAHKLTIGEGNHVEQRSCRLGKRLSTLFSPVVSFSPRNSTPRLPKEGFCKNRRHWSMCSHASECRNCLKLVLHSKIIAQTTSTEWNQCSLQLIYCIYIENNGHHSCQYNHNLCGFSAFFWRRVCKGNNRKYVGIEILILPYTLIDYILVSHRSSDLPSKTTKQVHTCLASAMQQMILYHSLVSELTTHFHQACHVGRLGLCLGLKTRLSFLLPLFNTSDKKAIVHLRVFFW